MYAMTTQEQIRRSFWEQHPGYAMMRRPGRQNAQPADIRMAFCDYVDMLERDKQISPELAQRVTL